MRFCIWCLYGSGMNVFGRCPRGNISAKGSIYLSNVRLVFVADKPVGSFYAFDMPLVCVLSFPLFPVFISILSSLFLSFQFIYYLPTLEMFFQCSCMSMKRSSTSQSSLQTTLQGESTRYDYMILVWLHLFVAIEWKFLSFLRQSISLCDEGMEKLYPF